MSAPSTPADVVILGGGSGGYACALRAAELGLSVVLIEKDKLGGTCLHRGCIPTKALLHAAEVADAAREGEQFGVKATLRGHRHGRRQRLQGRRRRPALQGPAGPGEEPQDHLRRGRAAGCVAPTAVEVDGTALRGPPRRARHRLVRHAALPGLEIDGTRVITSDHALQLDRCPASVVVLGGGVIGCEFASVWKSFGADVTIVEALPHLVPLEDEAVVQAARARVPQARHRASSSARGSPASSTPTNGVTVSLENGETIEAELLLVAVGRGPVTAGPRLRGGRRRDGARLRHGRRATAAPTSPTSPPSATSSRPCSSRTSASARASSSPSRSPASTRAPIDYDGVPRVTYSDPEVASVGLTEATGQGAVRRRQVETVTYDLAGNGKSQILKTAGFVKLVRQKDGPVVGIHMVGSRVGELIAEAQLIYNWEAYPDDVAQLIHAHPTQTEALGEAHLALAGKPLHAHG